MAKYIGDAVVIEFGTTDISGKYTSVEVAEEAPESTRIDVSDKGSTEIETIQGLSGEPKTTVNASINDETDGASPVLDFSINDQDTLIIYPEGKTDGKPMRTIPNSILSTRRQTAGYQAKAEWAVSFYAYETVTEGTYTT